MDTTALGASTPPASSGEISDRAFEQLRRLIQHESGIYLNHTKQALLVSRLDVRLRELRLSNYDDYYHHLLTEDRKGVELQHLINCVSTTKTEFFRECHHFDFLRNVAFREWRLRATSSEQRNLRLWSAACSKGHEPYSIALTFLESFPLLAAWDVRILATDINTKVLDIAKRGVYPMYESETIPESVRKQWCLKGTGKFEGRCRIGADARRLVSFAHLNLTTSPWPFHRKFDAIFCRNVIIYFNEATQVELIGRLVDRLKPSGYLFLGHSENQQALTDRLEHVGRTIYRRRD